MSGVLLVFGTTAFALGIGVYSLLPLGLTPIIFLSILVSGLLGILIRYGYDRVLVVGIFALIFLSLGMLRMEWEQTAVGASPLLRVVGDPTPLTGTVVREPELRERSLHVYVETGNDLLLVLTDRYAKVAYGDVLTLTGSVTKPEPFATDLGRTFNYPGYLRARGVEYQMLYPEVVVVDQGKGNWFLEKLFAAKYAFLAALSQHLPEPERGLAVGILLGVKASLGETLDDVFRTVGLTHIVVLSGFNVMIVVVSITTLLSYVLSLRLRVVIGLVCIVLFALVVGPSATVVRASIMAGIGLIAQVLGRTYAVVRALFLAGAVMLLVNPYLLVYDVGFQLSFMATLGLITITPLLDAVVPTLWSWFRKPREIILTTIAAQLAVLPLLIYQIGSVSLVSVVVNALVVPVVPVAMLCTFVAGVAALVSTPLATILAYPAYIVLAVIIAFSEWWAAVPFAAVVVPPVAGWFLAIMYLCLAVGVYWCYARVRNSEDLDLVADWVIEEEVVIEKGRAAPSAALPTLPIFFR